MLCVWSDACNVHKANIASSTYIEYYKQQHCTLFIGWLSVDVTMSQGHLGGWLVEFSIAHISSSSVTMYWVETWHKWLGGYYPADHNTLYFNARNFLRFIPEISWPMGGLICHIMYIWMDLLTLWNISEKDPYRRTRSVHTNSMFSIVILQLQDSVNFFFKSLSSTAAILNMAKCRTGRLISAGRSDTAAKKLKCIIPWMERLLNIKPLSAQP